MNDRSRKSKNGNTSAEPPSTLSGIFEPQDDSSGFIVAPEPHPHFLCSQSRYEILELIGRGGVGVVFRARDLDLDRDVALKILRLGVQSDSELSARFVNEARVMGRLQHPCIPHVYDSGFCGDGRPYHVMMLIQGRTLFSIMREKKLTGYRQAEFLNILARVAQAVAYSHNQGVIHLDLKPGNVMVGQFGEVHLMDWGLAKWDDEDSGQFRSKDEARKVRGTLEYMPPEQARGEELDERSDVFSLGAMLFEVFTGETVYPAKSKQGKHFQAVRNQLEWAQSRLADCDAHEPLVRLIGQCISADREKRPINATVISAEMWHYQATKLEQVQSDMARFFELSLDMFCIAGLDGYFQRLNSNFTRVLGYEESELLSQPFISFVHPDDVEATIDAVRVLSQGEPMVKFHNRYRSIDGDYLDFEWTAKSVPSENVIFAVARIKSD